MCRAHSCSLLAVVRVIVDVLGVMDVVLIGRHTVGSILVAIF